MWSIGTGHSLVSRNLKDWNRLKKKERRLTQHSCTASLHQGICAGLLDHSRIQHHQNPHEIENAADSICSAASKVEPTRRISVLKNRGLPSSITLKPLPSLCAQAHRCSVPEDRRKLLPLGRKFYGNFTFLLPFLYDTVQCSPVHSES